jgi:hypothetical protein
MEGIPETFGKKNPKTTEQGYFFCLPCDCEIKSLSNLRMHSKGANHMR